MRRRIKEIYVMAWLAGSAAMLNLKSKTPEQAQANVKTWAQNAVQMLERKLGIKHIVQGEKCKSPCIYAVQHTTWWETIIFLAELDVAPVIVAKAELKRVPILASMLDKLGVIFVNRQNPSLKEMLKKARDGIGQGRSIVMFPEGTRSKVSEVKQGVVLLARRLNVPVQVVTHNAKDTFVTGRVSGSREGVISLQFAEVLSPSQSPSEIFATLDRAYNLD